MHPACVTRQLSPAYAYTDSPVQLKFGCSATMAEDSPDIFATSLETFDTDVLAASAQRPIMVDFWAQWCPPCLVIAPILEQAVNEYAGGVALAKLEVDEGENMKLAGRYAVRGFPTVVLFQNGVERGRFSSAQRLDFILDFLDQHIV